MKKPSKPKSEGKLVMSPHQKVMRPGIRAGERQKASREKAKVTPPCSVAASNGSSAANGNRKKNATPRATTIDRARRCGGHGGVA